MLYLILLASSSRSFSTDQIFMSLLSEQECGMAWILH